MKGPGEAIVSKAVPPMLKRLRRWAAIAVLSALVLAWIAGESLIQRTNPPERFAGMIISQEADAVLRRACFDCHSNETRYPWYSYLPVASLVLAQHVREGREELNFSRWAQMAPKRRAKAIKESLEEIREGSMPSWDYLLVHPEARLTPGDQAILQQGAAKAYGAALEAEKTKGKEKGKERKERRKESRDEDDDED